MNTLIKILSIGICLLSPFLSSAQTKLVEGSITYKAVLNNPDGTAKEGVYIVSVKNNQVRKELRIGAEFENVIIFDNTEKLYTLKSVKEKNFAVEMSTDDYRKRNEKYEGATIKDSKDTKTIAGINARSATMSYKDGSSVKVFYTTDWVTEAPFVFERFEQLNGLPLAFDYKNDQGVVINFEAVKIDEGVVEDAKFKIPAGYKIISNEEYKSMRSR